MAVQTYINKQNIMKKHKRMLSIELKPWENEEEMHPNFHHYPNQNLSEVPRPQNNLDLPSSGKRSPTFVRNAKTVDPHQRHSKNNYIKKNQANLRSFNDYRQIANYPQIFNETWESIPFNSNASTISQLYKKPLISTTYISYFDNESFKSIENQAQKQRQRPRTSSALKVTKSTESNKIKKLRKRQQPEVCEFYEKKTYNNIHREHKQVEEKSEKGFQNYHLQKILKIKEKLRQKLKRNSNGKEIQREYYLSKKIKIMANKEAQSKEKKRSRQKLPINQQIYIDKWKMKMLKKKSETEINYKKYSKGNFAVVGGAIYK